MSKKYINSATEPYNVCLENITLDSMEISGIMYTGGYVGAYNVGGKLYFNSCEADDLVVFSGGAAGGLVGMMKAKDAKIIADFKNGTDKGEFGIISIISATTDSDLYGAGGIIGYRYTNSGSSENIRVTNVIIKNGTSVASGYIGNTLSNSAKVSSGGVVGYGDNTLLYAENVTVKNLNICGAKAGGFVGYLRGTNSKATIKNSEVISDTSPESCVIENTYNGDSSGNDNYTSGGFIGENYAPGGVIVTDSKLTGYTIAGRENVGGVIGKFSATATKAVKAVLTNVELEGHTIKGDTDVGGLVGDLTDDNNRELLGYNIRINNQKSEAYSGSSITNNGYIVGMNSNEKLVKIAGFSRQGIIDCEKMVGSPDSDNRYGTGGYVIFADYNDTGSTDHNEKFANVTTSNNMNVGAIPLGSITTTKTFYIVAKRDASVDNISDYNKVYNADFEILSGPILAGTPTTTIGEFDETLKGSEIKVLSSNGFRYRYQTNHKTEANRTKVRKWTYNQLYYVNENLNSNEQTPPSNGYSNANSSEITLYTTYCSEFSSVDSPDPNYPVVTTPHIELFVITEVSKQNTFEESDNSSPYVTTSPKTEITNTQWLTGDGLKRNTFVENIDHEKADTSKHKRYSVANTAIGDYDTSKIIDEFTTSFEEFGSDYGGKNFHMLVMEDTTPTATTSMLVNYLRLLTNTNYNFADSTYNEVSNESNVPFRVVRKVFAYNSGISQFVPQSTAPNLQYNETSGFYMQADKIDSAADVPQFTLVDVQFFDPGDSSKTSRKIAYHLYVPVYTRKIVQFRFSAAITSGTDYFTDPYSNTTLFENLGTPVSLKLTYAYNVRSNDEWKYSINNGESVMGNYYKSVNLKNETGTWKSGTKFTLVDSSNNGKVYYMGNFAGGNTDQVIDFSAFTDENNNSYVPLPLYDILNVVVGQVETGASLVQLKNGDDISTATVFYDGHYYKPNPGSSYSYDNNGSAITYSAEDTKYAVTSVSASSETYYLSIFTPKATVPGEPVHHFSFTSPDKLTNRTSEDIPQSKIKGSSTKIDLYTGDLYENTFNSLDVISNTTNDQKMTASNNSLTVTMNTTLQLTQNAKNAHIYENLASAANAAIYQTFLMTYSMKADENSSPKAGIQPGSSPDEGYISYTINGAPVTGTGKKINKNLNHIEFANGVNLKQYLTDENGSAEIQMSARIEYDPGNLSIQFPPNTEGANNSVGTNVVAYSKIASSVENIANSSTLKKLVNNTLYFSDIDSSASLKYSLDFEKSGNDPAGLYNDLGINAFEMIADTSVINTEARYDTSMINTSEDFIELTIRLSNRSAYANWLPLNKYLKSVNVYGSDGTTDLLAASNSDDIKVTKNQNDYIIRVNKDLLKTEGDKVYIFPIKLEVYTGNDRFNSSRDQYDNLIGLMYSNYILNP